MENYYFGNSNVKMIECSMQNSKLINFYTTKILTSNLTSFSQVTVKYYLSKSLIC